MHSAPGTFLMSEACDIQIEGCVVALQRVDLGV